MRLLSGLFLTIAVLALVLWLTARVAAGVSIIVAAMFLVLFLVSLLFRRKRPDRL